MRGSKPRVWMTGQAQGLHAPPAIAGRRIASRHRAERCRLASANYIHTIGVSNPDHRCSVAWQGIRPVVRDANTVRAMPSPFSTFSESLYGGEGARGLACKGCRRCRLARIFCAGTDMLGSGVGQTRQMDGRGEPSMPLEVCSYLRQSECAAWLTPRSTTWHYPGCVRGA